MTGNVCTTFHSHPSNNCQNISVWTKLVDWLAEIPKAVCCWWRWEKKKKHQLFSDVWFGFSICVLTPRVSVLTSWWRHSAVNSATLTFKPSRRRIQQSRAPRPEPDSVSLLLSTEVWYWNPIWSPLMNEVLVLESNMCSVEFVIERGFTINGTAKGINCN